MLDTTPDDQPDDLEHPMAARNLQVGFGLLTLNTKTTPATIKPPETRNLCAGQTDAQKHDPIPVIAPTQCTACGPITDRERLVKGIDAGGGAFALLDTEAVEEAKETYAQQYKKRINLVPHDAATFGAATAPGDSVNYLTPADAASADHYALLATLIERHPELAFVGLHTPVSATALFQVTVRSGVLVMTKRVREGSMKPVPEVEGSVNEQFLAMLEMSLPMLTTSYDATAYEDLYAAKVKEMLTTAEVTNGPAKVATTDQLMAQFAALASS